MKRLPILCIVALLLTAAHSVCAQNVTLASWLFNNSTATWGASPNPPNAVADHLTVEGLARGTGITTSGTAALTAWGGTGFADGILPGTSQTLATAVANNNFITIKIEAASGYKVSLAQISAYNIRRSAQGPQYSQWQYSLDNTNFTDIGTFDQTTSTAQGGNPRSAINLSTITALQNVVSGTTITIRIVLWNAASDAGTWYLNGQGTSPNLSITGQVEDSPLPLDLLRFDGKHEDRSNQLNWITAREMNVSHFELERGTDGRHFTKIAIVDAKGANSDATNQYRYEDNYAGDVAYYRLKMVDADGTARFSDIVTLRNGSEAASALLYPNPADKMLFLEGLQGNVTYRVVDATGKEVLAAVATAAGSTALTIDIASLAQGIYFLNFSNLAKNGTLRFVKK